MGKHSRNKGARFEREVAQMFRDLVGLDGIRRGRQDNKNRFTGNAHESDVAGVPGLWVETKHVAPGAVSLGRWWGQASRDADGTGRTPLVVFKWDRGPVLTLMDGGWFDSRAPGDFSLTRLQTSRVSWDKLPGDGERRCVAVPLSPPAILGRWEVFLELWRCRDS